MAMLFPKQNIRRLVMSRVDERIKDGQDRFDDGAALEDRKLAEGISALSLAHARAKLDLEDSIVASIIA